MKHVCLLAGYQTIPIALATFVPTWQYFWDLYLLGTALIHLSPDKLVLEPVILRLSSLGGAFEVISFEISQLLILEHTLTFPNWHVWQ